MSTPEDSIRDAGAWADHLALTVEDVDDEHCVATMPIAAQHLNFLEGTHGGALYSLMEYAVRSLAARHGDSPILVDSHLSLTAGSAMGDRLSANAVRVTGGRRLATYRVTVTRMDGRAVGEATAVVRFAT